jgi:hypothetical protein
MKLFNPVTKVAGLFVSEANVHSSNEDFPFIISITVSESDRQAPINCPKTSSQKSPCYFKVKVVKIQNERSFKKMILSSFYEGYSNYFQKDC